MLDEETIRRYHARNEHKARSRHAMSEALVNRAVELEVGTIAWMHATASSHLHKIVQVFCSNIEGI